VIILADDESEVDLIDGGTSLGLLGGIGASAGVTITKKVTEAFIGTDAQVDADAHGSGTLAPTGVFDISYVPNISDPFELVAPSIVNPSATSLILLFQRVATPILAATKGVSITATTRDDFETIATAKSGGLLFAVDLSGAVVKTNNTTTAHIDSGAKVNTNTPTADAAQLVRVAAAMDEYSLNLTDSKSVGGLVSASVGVAYTQYGNTTKAYIDGGEVRSKTDILITAS